MAVQVTECKVDVKAEGKVQAVTLLQPGRSGFAVLATVHTFAATAPVGV